jgi:hypothetical protein
MKFLFILTLCILLAGTSHSQAPSWLWAKSFSGSGYDQEEGSAVDHDGNLLVTGVFTDMLDFDPGPGVYNLTSAGNYDIFITKIDSNGNLLWAHNFGSADGDWGQSLTVDSDNNYYITGNFTGTVDFDPGASTFMMTGLASIFILKLDPMGNFISAVSMAQAPAWGIGISILIDNINNIYVTGRFEGTIDFDPGAGIYNLTGNNPETTFMMKLDSSLNFMWARKMGGGMNQTGNAPVALDTAANIYFAGYFIGTTDFDHGAGVFNLTAQNLSDAFVSKTDSSGNFIWARQLTGSYAEEGYSVVVSSGYIYTSGFFTTNLDADPGTATYNLITNGDEDNFLVKLSSDGDFVWGESFGGVYNDRAYALSIQNEQLILSGYFVDTVDFDPGTGTMNLISTTGYSQFVVAIDTSGSLNWVTSFFHGNTLARIDLVPVNVSCYVTGAFAIPVMTVGAYTLTNLSPSTGTDIFIAKLGDPFSSLDFIPGISWNLFPNPANDKIYVSIGIAHIQKVEIINEQGIVIDVIYPKDIVFDFSVKNYSPGSYIIKVITDSGCSAKKFIVW